MQLGTRSRRLCPRPDALPVAAPHDERAPPTTATPSSRNRRVARWPASAPLRWPLETIVQKECKKYRYEDGGLRTNGEGLTSRSRYVALVTYTRTHAGCPTAESTLES